MTTGTAISFNELRNRALARARELGTPSPRHEDWRYVDTRHLAEDWQGADSGERALVLPVGRSTEPGVVVTNGCWDPEATPELPAGVSVSGLAGDSHGGHPLLDRWAATLPKMHDTTACWTLADMRSAVEIRIDSPIQGPLILLNLATDACSAWRSVIRVAEGASAQILLLHLIGPTSRSSVGFEVELAAGSRLAIDEIEFAARDQTRPGQLLVHKTATLAADADLAWVSASRGGDLVRHRWDIALLEAGAQASVAAGCSLGDGAQAHHHLRMRHAMGGTTSKQRFKQVLDGGSRASFDGLVTIDKGADGAAADQLCSTLQLDDDSTMGVRPQLDIYADDVTATHGATIARLQDEELRYLRSRGIPAEEAERLLGEGFLGEIAQACSLAAARPLAAQQLAASTGGGPNEDPSMGAGTT